jgi:DNA repair protein RecO (recombination protein O)
VGLIAQGSRRADGGARALLQPFVALKISWVRRGELGRMTAVDKLNSAIELRGRYLLAGYYASELILRLLARDDPNPTAFAHYSECLTALGCEENVARTLRLFEYRLLQSLGFAFELERDVVSLEPIDPEARYAVDVESGPRRVVASGGYLGRDLISLREERLDDEASVAAVRDLLGEALERHLGGRRLRSRDVARDIVARGVGL